MKNDMIIGSLIQSNSTNQFNSTIQLNSTSSISVRAKEPRLRARAPRRLEWVDWIIEWSWVESSNWTKALFSIIMYIFCSIHIYIYVYLIQLTICGIWVKALGGGRERVWAGGEINILPPNDHQQITKTCCTCILASPGPPGPLLS